ncbi:efflux RND transporter periplasmic adaptor subunit [Aestuariivirga sp. YIM B02566]|uniref:Efflux RND transporter periplasmic adaptor subunit n=1 Tax=Taklimakanibacter albus TaxID=2800327 RepID=A0ACC5QXT1_9HYPH|nr:efflux RND transporter periplasmic adaptor subunit [Aestuariivirga sp. YIM B02566]MBK1865194.1 efflux RND transporter periplasmic adaptor subunit [Aestuariivirga sp. YIM B02566]
MLRRIIYLFLVLIIFGGLAGAIAYYAFDFKPKMIAGFIMSAPKPVETISAEEARQDQWEPEVSAIGSLTAVNGIEVAPQVGGIVREILFDSGDLVKKGQKLFQLDTDTEEADLKNFRVQFGNAETELDRQQKLLDKGFASKSTFDTARLLRDRMQAEIERTEALIAQKSIYAPWDGRLGLRDVAVGKYVAPGQNMIWLQTVDPIYVDFTVTENDFGRIKVGQKVKAKFSAYANDTFDGEVFTTDARVSEASRMITVRGKLQNPAGRLVPGMYSDVKVIVGEPAPVVTIPQSAVTYSLYGDSVFAVVKAKDADPNAKEPDLEAERRFVKLGLVRDGRVNVVEGIKPGDQVVIAGQNKIDQGSKVRIDNSIALNLTVDRNAQ